LHPDIRKQRKIGMKTENILHTNIEVKVTPIISKFISFLSIENALKPM